MCPREAEAGNGQVTEKMKIKKNNKGFTMAELLIVVAITVILAGVAFIGVQSYQHSSTRLEYDGIAKEIFIAAQNHLTTAQGQGYLQIDSDEAESQMLGTKITEGAEYEDEYYFTYTKGSSPYSTDPLEMQSLLDLMLPFGSIDETVRSGGTYIIHYQKSSGRVLDVFYSLPGRSGMLTVPGVALSKDDYSLLMTDYRFDEHRKDRERFPGANGTGVVGWYGGEEGLPVGTRLEDPELVVHNEEVLWIEVTDKNIGNGSLQLTLTGKTSGAQRSFDLRSNDEDRVESGIGAGKIKVILDDITRSGYHFADLVADDINKHFIPGEDVVVEAVAYNNAALSNVASSGKRTTNSLFADYEASGEGANTDHTALIENFRHFENLDKNISSFNNSGVWKKQDGSFETITKAKQIKDMIWTKETTASPTAKPDSFIEAVKYINGTEPSSIFNKDNTPVTTEKRFYPVSPDYKLDYEGASYGQNHKISNVEASHGGAAGLFGSVDDSEVRNLELIDFNIKGTTSAGALIGSATGTTITNVLAHNSAAGFTANVTASGGDAGGLIGSAANCTVSRSAAALTVNGSANAGGLIGSASDTRVTESYAGGHTNKGKYYTDSGEAIYNVTGGTNAGGLIGSMTGGSATNCYSTCSATGGTVGGFVGESTGSISNSYCTGLVKGTTEGAFAGSLSNAPSNCNYIEIINERQDPTKGYTYLSALGNQANAGITPIDENMTNYDAFCGAPGTWDPAKPYDGELVTIYKNSFNLRTVDQIGKTPKAKSSGTDFVSTHYGDWPAPEVFVFNAG